MESIRTLERDLDFYKSVVETIMKEDQLYKVKAKSRYDVENNKWTVPPFVFKAEEVNFPKLKANRMRDLIESEKENNLVEFKPESDMNSRGRKTNNFNLDKHSSSQNSNGNHTNSYENTGDSENRYMEGLQSPDRIESRMEHMGKFHSTNGTNNDFFNAEYPMEPRSMIKDKSQDSLGFSKNKGLPLKQKTLRRAELAAKIDQNNQQTIDNDKLPPSIRWVSTDNDPDPDFFSSNNARYQRNPKAIAQLAPLMGNGARDPSALDWKSALKTEPDHRISLNELSQLKKKNKLKPLRD